MMVTPKWRHVLAAVGVSIVGGVKESLAIDLIPVTNSDAFNGFFTMIFLIGIPVFLAAAVAKVLSRS